jgi:hypothetical protein
MSASLRVCARAFTVAALAAAAICAAAPAALAEARTTRIETRPFYGATVTLEEGVRVFRPLPRHDRIIINPEGKTPLSLQFNETHEQHFHQGGASASSSAEAGSSAGPGVFGPARDGRGHRNFRRFGDGHRGHGGSSRR